MSDLNADAPDPFWTGVRNFLAEISALAVAAVSFALLVPVLAVLREAGFDLFGLVWLGVVPLGALLSGILAAAGCYTTSLLFQVKPTRLTGAAMMAMAALTQAALYLVGYLESGGAGLSGFLPYVDQTLRHLHFSVTLYGQKFGGSEMGAFGYLTAFFQFLALLAGGFIPYAILADKPHCPKDRIFHKAIVRVSRLFEGGEREEQALRGAEEGSRTYFERLRALPEGKDRKVELWLSRCPRCGDEALIEKLFSMKDGKPSLTDVKHRTMRLRTGRSVESEVRASGLVV